MGSGHNRLRKKWQDYSGKNAGIAESSFFVAFNTVFDGTDFRIRKKPKEFSKIYVDVELMQEELAQIYIPSVPVTKHGVFPDYAIDNVTTGKTLYVEVKRQDGWVEGKKRADGRGNAHERSCKFFTPGLLKIPREKSGIDSKHLPFWTVFLGDITRDPCRVREIACWYAEYKAHYFLWRKTADPAPLLDHFEERLAPLLA
ncbi:MAG TPA: MunI family type II restriction endonuclease [Gammaproteobacteria bacterium]|nr:MunI family type II restriction endonuclease [Gammaproteobacteria bacterium]